MFRALLRESLRADVGLVGAFAATPFFGAPLIKRLRALIMREPRLSDEARLTGAILALTGAVESCAVGFAT